MWIMTLWTSDNPIQILPLSSAVTATFLFPPPSLSFSFFLLYRSLVFHTLIHAYSLSSTVSLCFCRGRMKHFMQPRNTILRETDSQSSSSSASSPNPNSVKQRSASRKQKWSKENAPPSDLNTMADHSSPSLAAKSLPPSGKIRSPLPPRPPSSNSNPLKRKLSMDTVPENAVPGASDSGVRVNFSFFFSLSSVWMRAKPNQFKGKFLVSVTFSVSFFLSFFWWFSFLSSLKPPFPFFL